MTDEYDELDRARLSRDSRNRLKVTSTESPSAFVGYVTSNPGQAGKYIKVVPLGIYGAETEGGAPSLSTGSQEVIVLLVGDHDVNTGDTLLCVREKHRWIADGYNVPSSGISLPGCPCHMVPSTLTMTSSKPTSNNHIFQNASLVYGPPPASLSALNLGANCFLSTTTFLDFSTGDSFYYYFSCFLGFYIITRVYETSIYATPYRDQIRYRWLAGTSGNTCSPFSLVHGTIFAGGDATCIVSVTG